ncbi:hypothetical protein MPSI1_000739 [Malassezia psittaci]|uniref:SET domain-containing protein n=1 Tax=Malassezia psittaci TaxID=1821823 RepID=A0AAF0F9A3_9BASI|nr:hypothetical protein MPSI1_000739 [Malassezia psittaci]
MEDALVEYVTHASRRTPKVKLSHSVAASLPCAFPTSPLLWQIRSNAEDQKLFQLLSYTAKSRAMKVFRRFELDWQRIEDARRNTPGFLQEIWRSLAQTSQVPLFSQDDFLWAWLCTNSRCIYMDLNYLEHADNFTLAPLLDMANHTAIPWLECNVRYTSSRNLELLAPNKPRPENAGRVGLRKGDEVCITYGAHANSTLLAEYGFVLPRTLFPEEAGWKGNRYCDICLDEYIEKTINDQGELDGSSISCRDAERVWLLTTNGANQMISQANEDAVRSELIRLINEILQLHTSLLQKLDALPSTEPTNCVREILEEETDIAKLVQASVEGGDVW